MDTFSSFFDVTGFMPHGHCFLWTPSLLWAFAVADTLIGLSYLSIPAAIWTFKRRRRDLPFEWIFVLFSAFIFACGTTHLISVWEIWHPAYPLDASVKSITAILSIMTAAILWPLLPRALAIPSGTQLAQVNRELKNEIGRRVAMEEQLLEVNRGLDMRITARTAELQQINDDLRDRAIERDHALGALGRSQLLLDSIVNNATTLISVKNTAGQYLLVNRRYSDALGLPQTSILGKADHDLFSPERADAYCEGDRLVLNEAQPRQFDIVRVHHDGRHDYLLEKFPIRDSGGSVYAVGAIATDITERRRSEQALRESEVRLREVFEAVLHGLIVVDHKGRIEIVNRQVEILFGYAREELIGSPVDRLMPPRFRDGHLNLFLSYLAEPSARTMAARRDLYGVRGDGTEFPIEIGLNPVRSGELIHVLATITDITERKSAQEHIEKELKEKTVLLNEVHHRVKNNLQVILSLLKMQARHASPEVQAALTGSYGRVGAMALVHQLLYEQPELSRIRLGTYLQRLVSLLRQSFADRHNRIQTQFAGTDADIFLTVRESIPFGLIVNEIVTNSFKHGFPGNRSGTITLSLKSEGLEGGCLIIPTMGSAFPIPCN
jgi:PAS domain S-box-containing protein